MGALSGSLTTTAYFIEGELPDDFRDRYLASLGRLAFKEIDLALDQDESLGWVNIADPFDVDFDLNKVLWGDYLLASLRHDVIRLPANAFKLHLNRAMAERLEETGKQRLSKGERDDVKEMLTRQLRKRVLPAIKTHDLVWNIPRREAWLFTTNKTLNELFVDLFEDTFELKAHQLNPYSALERMGMDAEQLEHVLTLEPAAMAAMPR